MGIRGLIVMMMWMSAGLGLVGMGIVRICRTSFCVIVMTGILGLGAGLKLTSATQILAIITASAKNI